MITHITKPPVPVEALRLNEDISCLKMSIKLLKLVEPHDELWKTIQKLRMFQSDAEQKLRREYLAPVKRGVR